MRKLDVLRAMNPRMGFGLFENTFIRCGSPVLFIYETAEAVFEFAKITINKEQGYKAPRHSLHVANCSFRYRKWSKAIDGVIGLSEMLAI